jgi:hypothetical protein
MAKRRIPMPVSHHIHIFSAKIFSDRGHLHFYSGISSQADREEPAHTHLVQTTTTVADGHDHVIDMETGPAVQTGAGHVHLISGMTAENGQPPHGDRLNDLTGPSLAVRQVEV